VISVLAILFGLYLFFDRSLLGVGHNLSMLLGLVGILGGAAGLIMRLRPGTEEDEDHDDGAVV
jgi:hypothetical protein